MEAIGDPSDIKMRQGKRIGPRFLSQTDFLKRMDDTLQMRFRNIYKHIHNLLQLIFKSSY